MLRHMGISAVLAAHMVKSGWLRGLSRGVYLLTGDTPTKDGSIEYLTRRIAGLHVGGKAALSCQGVCHNIAFREKIVLWGRESYRTLSWVDQYLIYLFRATVLFDDDLPYEKGLKPLPAGDPEVKVSVPERSHTGTHHDIGKGQSLEEASSLMVSLRNLHADVLAEILSHCRRAQLFRPHSAMLPVEEHAACAVAQQGSHVCIATPTDAQQPDLASGASESISIAGSLSDSLASTPGIALSSAARLFAMTSPYSASKSRRVFICMVRNLTFCCRNR
ncbi:hypothetical protein J2793_006697 [Paraburkholderia caledonica]|uniref:Transcriptional regulator AbiEi antitoxin N-terminal domain-containing protein n=1 Tax=Paraburkholderia caledonica TaxID=134536 RepID=A0AB73IPC8_9BURK|nr:hypothetical protein [Paraburkholderia caledonica]